MVLRFSEAELTAVRERATLAGLALGAWIGQTVLDVALRGSVSSPGLPDLLRLHADVVSLERAASASGMSEMQVVHLQARLDAVIDAVVAEFERRRP